MNHLYKDKGVSGVGAQLRLRTFLLCSATQKLSQIICQIKFVSNKNNDFQYYAKNTGEIDFWVKKNKGHYCDRKIF